MSNLGVPPCPSFISEVLTVLTALALHNYGWVPFAVYFTLRGVYRFRLYCQLTHGRQVRDSYISFDALNLRDILSLFLLFFPLVEVLFK